MAYTPPDPHAVDLSFTKPLPTDGPHALPLEFYPQDSSIAATTTAAVASVAALNKKHVTATVVAATSATASAVANNQRRFIATVAATTGASVATVAGVFQRQSRATVAATTGASVAAAVASFFQPRVATVGATTAPSVATLAASFSGGTTATIDATTASSVASVVATTSGRNANISATTSATAVTQAVWTDPYRSPGIMAGFGGGAWDAGVRLAPGLSALWSSGVRSFGYVDVATKDASSVWAGLRSEWISPTAIYKAALPAHTKGTEIIVNLDSLWVSPDALYKEANTSWDAGAPLYVDCRSGFVYPPSVFSEKRTDWKESVSVWRDWLQEWKEGSRRVKKHSVIWGQGWGLYWHPVWPPTPRPPPPPPWKYIPSTDLAFVCKLPTASPHKLDINFLRAGCPWETPSSYSLNGYITMMNSVEVVRVSDNHPIIVGQIQLAFDRESWVWSIQFNVYTAADMVVISPIAGDPVEVKITINGFVFVGIVESLRKQRAAGNSVWTAYGRSSAAMLMSPYVNPKTITQSAARTGSQLLDDELQYTGWTTDISAEINNLFTTLWTIPGGTYSYMMKSPMESITAIAKAVGARAYAHRFNKVIKVSSRYPVDPRDWATALPDVVVSSSVIQKVASELTSKPAYNHVMVSGTTVHGVLGDLILTGTAGDVEAPMVTDQLITVIEAASERGRTILADSGKQERVTLEIPLLDAPGLIEPGMLVEVHELGVTWRGMSTGVSIQFQGSAVVQTVYIERHYP